MSIKKEMIITGSLRLSSHSTLWDEVQNSLKQAQQKLQASGQYSDLDMDPLPLYRPKMHKIPSYSYLKHYHFYSPIALLLTGDHQEKVRSIAEQWVAVLKKPCCVEYIEVADYGFINFFLHTHSVLSRVEAILQQGDVYYTRLSVTDDECVSMLSYAYVRTRDLLTQWLASDANTISKYENLCVLDNNVLTDLELSLIISLDRCAEQIKMAALSMNRSCVVYELRSLACHLHDYYNRVNLVCEEPLRTARWCLLQAAYQILRNGLHTLGILDFESVQWQEK